MHVLTRRNAEIANATSPRNTIALARAYLMAAAFVLTGASAPTAEAGALSGTRIGWGYDSEPDRNYGCDFFCFANPPRKGGIEIIRLGTGSYEIDLAGIYKTGPSDVQVGIADENIPGYCATSGWSVNSHKAVDAFVNCYDAGGNPMDSILTFVYQSRNAPFGSADKGIAFLWADQPTEASYTPNLAYQYNSTGATNTMVRNGTGSYTASIPGLTKKGGNVQVTAYGSGPARCKVSSWSTGQSGTSVNVLCFDATGAAADEMFTLAYTIGEPLGLYKNKQYIGYGDAGAYVWADKPNKTDLYTPPHAYNYNGFNTGGLTVQRNSTGYYTVTLSGVGDFGGSAVLVTANGTSNGYCSAGNAGSNWIPITVYCFDQNGNPADSEFSVLLQTDVKN